MVRRLVDIDRIISIRPFEILDTQCMRRYIQLLNDNNQPIFWGEGESKDNGLQPHRL